MSRISLGLLALTAFCSGTLRAGESTPFPWDHEGYRSILDASAVAKGEGQPILVGLSGSHG